MRTLRIRIKPHDIKVPEEGDPFRDDALERKESVEILARLIRSVDGPGVFGVDAEWGNGKTTFIRMLERFLENDGVPVVSFNAWENDYVSDPFTAIATELTDGLIKRDDALDEQTQDSIKKGLECAKAVMRTRRPAMLKALLGAAAPVVGKVLEEVIDGIADYHADERVSAYREAREAVKKFREALQDMAQAVSKEPKQHMAQAVSEEPKQPLLVVTIDELDRCRPSYAVELLEVAKHLFSVDGVVFVVAVNRKELAHSVQALYGPAFDAQGYLGRFLDVDFRLPDPNRKHFIEKTIQKVGIEAYLERTPDERRQSEFDILQSMLVAFFGEKVVGLRTVARAIHHIGLVYEALADHKLVLGTTTAVLIILRTLDRDLYYRFVRGEVSDAEVIDGVTELLGSNMRARHDEEMAAFEASIAIGQLQRDRRSPDGQNGPQDTPLIGRYRKAAKGDEPEGPLARTGPLFAKRVLEKICSIRKSYQDPDGVLFTVTVKRIELFSPDLGEEPDKPPK